MALKHHIYRIAISYFALFALALLGTGSAMFWLKTGMNTQGIFEYYGAKSITGLSELAHPHLGGMGLFIMVLGHFYCFSAYRQKVQLYFIAMFVAALLVIATPFALMQGYTGAAVLKLAALVMLVLFGTLFSIMLWYLAKESK